MFESIGQRLKREREARFQTLEKASEATRIRINFLKALEADDYSVMPSAAQGRGFLRNYAEYLELDIDEMIAEIQKNVPVSSEVSGPLPQVNLVETELPSLTDAQDEKLTALSWMSKLVRRPKTESEPATESPQPLPEQNPEPLAEEIKVEPPKPRGRKKKINVEETPSQLVEVTEIKPEEIKQPVDEEQVEVSTERNSWRAQISSLLTSIRSRFVKAESESDVDVETESIPIIKPQIQQPVPSQTAAIIFAEIGAKLRERRELISLTIEEVERHTKLRVAFIKALEEGAFDKLPSPVQTRGMLANYATFLDLDLDAILLRFADGLQARRYEKYAETPREKIQTEVVSSLPFLRTFIAGDLIFGAAMIAILAALAIWGIGRVVNSQEAKNGAATAPPIVNVLGSTPLATETLISVNNNSLTLTATVDPLLTVDAPTPGVSANVTVSIFAVERAFARVSVDGKVAFEGRFAPGETKEFAADNQVSILTGNASALRVTYNGRDLGLMGNIGEVVNRVYLISGIAFPTATITPTAVNTLPPSITPRPSITPSITPTIRPPDGG